MIKARFFFRPRYTFSQVLTVIKNFIFSYYVLLALYRDIWTPIIDYMKQKQNKF